MWVTAQTGTFLSRKGRVPLRIPYCCTAITYFPLPSCLMSEFAPQCWNPMHYAGYIHAWIVYSANDAFHDVPHHLPSPLHTYPNGMTFYHDIFSFVSHFLAQKKLWRTTFFKTSITANEEPFPWLQTDLISFLTSMAQDAGKHEKSYPKSILSWIVLLEGQAEVC